MQIPSEWHTHILPGIIILACVLPLIKPGTMNESLKLIQEQAVGSAIFLGIVAYVVGFAANAFALNIIKPLLNHFDWLDKPETPTTNDWILLYRSSEARFVQLLMDSYQNMILFRSIFGGFLLLSLSSIMGICWHRNKLVLRSAILIALITITFALYKQWWSYRSDYHNFVKVLVSFVKDNNTIQKKVEQ